MRRKGRREGAEWKHKDVWRMKAKEIKTKLKDHISPGGRREAMELGDKV